MSVQGYDWSSAVSALAIANTPLFLVQKLQEDPVVRSVSIHETGEEVLEALKEAVRTKPETLTEAVIPYALLVALYSMPHAAYLQKTSAIQPSYGDPWYAYIRQLLMQTYQPTQRQVLELRVKPTITVSSTSATSHHSITSKYRP